MDSWRAEAYRRQTPFGNPAEIFKDIIVKEAVVDYQYVISNWKERVV